MKNKSPLPQIHLDWTVDGLRFALREGRIVAVADILRFSSAVTTAVANGFTIYPVADQRKVTALARRVCGQAAGRSGEARFSLSPSGYLGARDIRNKKIVLWSPNGAACASMIKKGHRAYVGCLLNARALGVHLTRIAIESGRKVTLIAAGEQQAFVNGERILYDVKSARRVFAVEDYLGCGAILSYVRLPKTPEAKVCELAFRASRRYLRKFLMGSFSGRFLQGRKLSRDVAWASQLNKYDVVPVIRAGRIEAVREK
jgi:2-phosphosulfolactate phosphatase